MLLKVVVAWVGMLIPFIGFGIICFKAGKNASREYDFVLNYGKNLPFQAFGSTLLNTFQNLTLECKLIDYDVSHGGCNKNPITKKDYIMRSYWKVIKLKEKDKDEKRHKKQSNIF